MTALAVPLICSPLKDQAVQFSQQSYSHLADLELADHPTEDCDSEVDVLIGNDFYWSFFTGDMKRGESGPVAMKTSLGWVLSGPMPHAPGSGSDVNLVTCHTLRLKVIPGFCIAHSYCAQFLRHQRAHISARAYKT